MICLKTRCGSRCTKSEVNELSDEASVYTVLSEVIGELSNETHRSLANSILDRLEHVKQDDQLDALERIIREMVNATDVLRGGE